MPTSLLLSSQEFALKYQSKKGLLKGGSLCFWGQWFGKPYDNFHEISTIEFNSEKNILTLVFNANEKLIISYPAIIEEQTNRIEIKTADSIYFAWYDYGKPQTPKHLLYYHFIRTGKKISGKNNIHWSSINAAILSVNNPALLIAHK